MRRRDGAIAFACRSLGNQVEKFVAVADRREVSGLDGVAKVVGKRLVARQAVVQQRLEAPGAEGVRIDLGVVLDAALTA